MRVLTSAQMAAFDRWAIDDLGVPESVLVENAAVGVVDAILETWDAVGEICVVCGPGNNGADGFAVARHLLTRGQPVSCIALNVRASNGAEPRRQDPSSEVGRQGRVFERLGGRVFRVSLDDSEAEAGRESGDAWRTALDQADLVVDAMFGTGLSRPLKGVTKEIVHRINSGPGGRGKIVSVDLPSGLCASAGRLFRNERGEEVEPVQANLTVAFARPKLAHVIFPAAAFCGDLEVVDLGVPYSDRGEGPWANLVDLDSVAYLLKPRSPASHKGDFGRVSVVAGSEGMAGAAGLATLGCLRSGAGLVTCLFPGSVRTSLSLSTEAMSKAIGGPERAALSEADGDEVADQLQSCDSFVFGPGIGRDESTLALGRRLLAEARQPHVIDADGLLCIDPVEDTGRDRDPQRILTPHPGELSRLLEVSVDDIESDRLDAARRAAQKFQSVVVLKGAGTVVAEPHGEVWINGTGGPVLAAGGSGDVLAGVVGSLLAQGHRPIDAALVGVFVHGLAADLLTARRSRAGVGAQALAEAIPEALEVCYRRQGELALERAEQ